MKKGLSAKGSLFLGSVAANRDINSSALKSNTKCMTMKYADRRSYNSYYQIDGKGYTGIMADVLNYVANNPKILSKASGNYS